MAKHSKKRASVCLLAYKRVTTPSAPTLSLIAGRQTLNFLKLAECKKSTRGKPWALSEGFIRRDIQIGIVLHGTTQPEKVRKAKAFREPEDGRSAQADPPADATCATLPEAICNTLKRQDWQEGQRPPKPHQRRPRSMSLLELDRFLPGDLGSGIFTRIRREETGTSRRPAFFVSYLFFCGALREDSARRLPRAGQRGPHCRTGGTPRSTHWIKPNTFSTTFLETRLRDKHCERSSMALARLSGAI